MVEEHTHAHYTHSNSDGGDKYILPVAVILAAIILSATMFLAAGGVNSNLIDLKSEVAKLNSASAVRVTPTPAAVVPTPTPEEAPKLSESEMQALFSKAAGTKGNEDAKVTILEFSDYQCPYCRVFYMQAYKQIEEQYVSTGKAKLAYLDFPLPFHPAAAVSANAVRCAGEQGKYWEAHNRVFDKQVELDPQVTRTVSYTVDDLKTWIGEVPGIDKEKLNACIDANKYSSQVQENMQLGSANGIEGTPGFIINGEIVSGAQPFENFKKVIEAALKD